MAKIKKSTAKPGSGLAAKSQYTAKEITVLKGLDPVRKRPGMYIGTTGEAGLHHLIWEVVDNAIDEAIAGYCTDITVRLLPDNKVEISDNGRGIPVDTHKETKKSALETVLTTLHAGGKFGAGGYKVSGGLHGVGVSVVNALSAWVKAEVRRDGQIWVQEYKRGKPVAKVKPVGKTKQTGTTITFDPDPDVFPEIKWNWNLILNRLRQYAYLTKKIKIIIFDQREKGQGKDYTFYFEGGIATYVRYLNTNKEIKHPTIFYIEKELDEIQVEIALQYTDDYQETVYTFANNILNPGGGTHLVGFKTALTRTLNNFARAKNYLKEKDDNLTGEDVREGLTAIVSVKIKEPQFEGQTKDKLGNPEVRTIVDSVFSEAFAYFLEENPGNSEKIIEKCIIASRARAAAKSARETILRKGVLEGLALPGKLADCSSKEPGECELYIVEGDSAGGSAKQGRDREFQAILPMWGKMINVEKTRLDKILTSDKIKPLIIALGTNIGEQFELDKLRYDRIIIMADADVDGSHIRTLLLTLFYRYFKPLIEQGHIYIAQPPLYKIQKGAEAHYAYTDEEKEKILADMAAAAKTKPAKKSAQTKTDETPTEGEAGEGVEVIEGLGRVNIQRYKGLGEMNPGQLWETTMDPNSRIMKKITIEDAQRADQIFEILMGSEVAPRKRFIQTRAKEVENLDI